MKKITLLALLAFLILSTCKKDETTHDTPDDPPVFLVETTIDGAGGVLSSEAFELIIPAGAFSESNDLKLQKDENDKPFNTDQVSPVYILEGLPENIKKPLKVSIKVEDTGKEDYFIAKGEDNFVSSLDSVNTSYAILPTDTTSGWLSCEIPISDGKGGKEKSKGNKLSLKFSAIWGYQVMGEGTHFLIYTPPSLFLQAEELHGYLEEAYTKFTQLPFNFTYEIRTSWPVTVTIKTLGNAVYGYYCNSIIGHNHGYLEFNRNKMNDADELRTTAGHEFLHLVQALYDPRSRFDHAKYPPEWHWLNEAFAIWAEEFFSNTPNYVSSVRKHTQFDPFEGAIKGAQTEAGLHGYGMAAFIKYLHDHFPAEDKIYSQVYDNIAAGKDVVTALGIFKDPDDFDVWESYSEFLDLYVTGDLYNDVDVDLWKNNVVSKFIVEDENDTTAVFSNSYPQMSAKFYEVIMDYPELHKGATLGFSTNLLTSSTTLFKYKDNQIEKVYKTVAGVEFNYFELKQDMDNGWNYLFLVVNDKVEAPYVNSDQLKLYIDIEKPEISLPPHVDFEFHYDAYLKWNFEDLATYGPNGFNSWNMIHNGNFNEFGYFATWDTINVDDWHFKGSIWADIDVENEKINWIRVRALMNTGSVKDTISFKVMEVPSLSWGEDYTYFKIEGNNILSHITEIFYKREAYGNTLSQSGYDCGINCRFELTLDKYNY